MPFFVPFCLRSPKPTEARKKKYSKKKPSVNNTRLPLRKISECFVPLYLRTFPSGDRLHPVAGDAGGSPARAGGGGLGRDRGSGPGGVQFAGEKEMETRGRGRRGRRRRRRRRRPTPSRGWIFVFFVFVFFFFLLQVPCVDKSHWE